MRALMEAFPEGGPTMYLVLVFALAAHVAAVAGPAAGGFSRRERGILFGGLALGLGLIALGVGYLGYHRGLGLMERALQNVDPEIGPALRAQGTKEAMHNLTFGLYALVVPGLVGAALLLRAATLAPSRDPALPPPR